MLTKPLRNKFAFWKKIPESPTDKILYFNQLYNQDSRSPKVNLTIGAYRDNEGKPWNLPCVNEAVLRLRNVVNQQYLPPIGDKEFTNLAIKIAYSEQNGLLAGTYQQDQIAKVQTLSGAGGLLLTLHTLKEFYQPLQEVNQEIWMSQPTWPNHDQMSRLQGFQPKYYEYYDLEKREFVFDKMLASLKNIPKNSIVIFHPVGHNPTGFDPSHEQWQQILQISQEKNFMNVFDMAYQGFVSGDLNKDAYAVQLFAQNKLPMIVIQSFAKNFGLYGQRIGCMSIPCETKQQAQLFEGFFGNRVRSLYSTNPRFGSDIIKTVLGDEQLRKQWDQDILTMSQRIIKMRQQLFNEISKHNPKDDWSYITQQQGMFAYTHLTKEQVIQLREKYAIYMLEMGRVSICGLNDSNIDTVAKAFVEVTKK